MSCCKSALEWKIGSIGESQPDEPMPQALQSPLPVVAAMTGALQSANPAAGEIGPSGELSAAWEREPRCLECGARVESVDDEERRVGPQRVVHRSLCFVPALLRHYPYLRRLAAHANAKEVRGAPFPANGENGEEEGPPSGRATHLQRGANG